MENHTTPPSFAKTLVYFGVGMVAAGGGIGSPGLAFVLQSLALQWQHGCYHLWNAALPYPPGVFVMIPHEMHIMHFGVYLLLPLLAKVTPPFVCVVLGLCFPVLWVTACHKRLPWRLRQR